MADKLRVAITPEAILPDEARRVALLLDSRWDFVHLRHPGASRRDMLNLIKSIPQRYHSRLRLHSHFDLAAEFNLGGLHLNGRCPEPPACYSGSLSKTCHSIAEVAEARGMDYVTLSPVFDSVSKPGYRGAFDAAAIELPAGVRVLALGGVTPENAGLLDRFAGYAVLGSSGWTLPVEDMARQISLFR